MHNLHSLQDVLHLPLPQVRKLTKLVFPEFKLFTNEQVLYLIEARERMKAGLSWKDLEARYQAKKNLQLLEDSYRRNSSPSQETELEDEQVSLAPIQHITINIYIH